MEIKIQNLKSKKNIFYTVKNNETLIDIAKKISSAGRVYLTAQFKQFL